MRIAKKEEKGEEAAEAGGGEQGETSSSRPQPPLSTSVKRLSEENPTWRTHVPKEIAEEWLGLMDKDQLAWMREERGGKRVVVIWKRE